MKNLAAKYKTNQDNSQVDLSVLSLQINEGDENLDLKLRNQRKMKLDVFRNTHSK